MKRARYSQLYAQSSSVSKDTFVVLLSGSVGAWVRVTDWFFELRECLI